MSLFLATLLPGLLLVALGSLLVWNGSPVGGVARAMPRSARASYLFFGAAAAWFLYKIAHLGEADFGNFRTPLFIAFAMLALLSFRYVPDFLAVRGLALLMLLAAKPLLGSAYMQYDEPARLFLVSLVYLGILLALYLAAVPYRLRDFFGWLFARGRRARILGGALLAYGVLLTVAAASY